MTFLEFLYLNSGILFGLAFLPQIAKLWRDKTGAASISISTWLLFTACSVVSVTYFLTKVNDKYIILCAAIAAIGNLTILALASLRRLQHKLADRNTSA